MSLSLGYAQYGACYKPTKFKQKKANSGISLFSRKQQSNNSQNNYYSGIGIENTIFNGPAAYYHFTSEINNYIYLVHNIGITYATEPKETNTTENYRVKESLGGYGSTSLRIYLSSNYRLQKGWSTHQFPGQFVGVKIGAHYIPGFETTQFYYFGNAHIGTRRVFFKRLIFELSAGIGNNSIKNKSYSADNTKNAYINPEINGQLIFLLF